MNRARLGTVSKAIALVIAFVCGFMLRPAFGTETLSTDGSWWEGVSTDSRPDIVAAMIDSFQQAYFLGRFYGFSDGVIAAETQVDKKTAARLDSWLLKAKEPESAPVPHFPNTFGTYVNELTDFYRDHPDLVTRVTVGQLMECESDFPGRVTCDELVQENQ